MTFNTWLYGNVCGGSISEETQPYCWVSSLMIVLFVGFYHCVHCRAFIFSCSCWLSIDVFIYGFVVPIVFVICVNAICLILIIKVHVIHYILEALFSQARLYKVTFSRLQPILKWMVKDQINIVSNKTMNPLCIFPETITASSPF